MNWKRRFCVIFFAFGIATSLWAYLYTVQIGDTLSEIANKNLKGEIYGSLGNLTKILKLNSSIKNQNLIFPGQKIELGENNLTPVARNIEENIIRDPAQIPELSEPNKSSEFSRFELSTILYQSRLDAKDSSTGGKSVFGSSFSPSLNFKWDQNWANGVNSFLLGHIRREDFQTTSSTHTISSNKKNLFGFGFGAKLLTLGKRAKLLSAIHLDQEAFTRAPSSSVLTVDALAVPKLSFDMEYEVLRSEVFKLSSILGSSYLAPMSGDGYKTKSGFSIGAGLRITHEREKTPFFGGVNFNHLRQNTTITKQSYTNVGLEFGMQFDLVGK